MAHWPSLGRNDRPCLEMGAFEPQGRTFGPQHDSEDSLADRFYVGFFRWLREEHPGKHEPLISMDLFEQVQWVMVERGRRHYRTKKQRRPLAFLGFFRCDECGARVTA